MEQFQTLNIKTASSKEMGTTPGKNGWFSFTELPKTSYLCPYLHVNIYIRLEN